MNGSDNYLADLEKIPFYSKDRHPEYLPFIGEDYEKYRILHIGESHYIPNREADCKDKKGEIHQANEITINDFDGWWEGKQSEKLYRYLSWYNTREVVKDYLDGIRTKGHGIFTNTIKAFCNSVLPDEAFDSISTEHSHKYNYFAYMNFYQMPSIYRGMNYTKALYRSGKQTGFSNECIDSVWYRCMEESANVFEAVVGILKPKTILITSEEVWRYYCRYARKNEDGNYSGGSLVEDPRIIHVAHPGSCWWNRKKKNDDFTSKEQLERKLIEIYR